MYTSHAYLPYGAGEDIEQKFRDKKIDEYSIPKSSLENYEMIEELGNHHTIFSRENRS